MEQWMLEILKQVPALGVLSWITSQFLRDRRERDREVMAYDVERDKQVRATIAELNTQCHLVQRDSITVMSENKVELGRMREATTQLQAATQNLLDAVHDLKNRTP